MLFGQALSTAFRPGKLGCISARPRRAFRPGPGVHFGQAQTCISARLKRAIRPGPNTISLLNGPEAGLRRRISARPWGAFRPGPIVHLGQAQSCISARSRHEFRPGPRLHRAIGFQGPLAQSLGDAHAEPLNEKPCRSALRTAARHPQDARQARAHKNRLPSGDCLKQARHPQDAQN